MKKLCVATLIVLVSMPAFAVVESLGTAFDRVVEIFQSAEEPDAMDAVWESRSLLKIGVFDHDKDYADYAAHACDVVAGNGLSEQDIRVQIIDLKKLIETEKWVVLGSARCH